MVPTKRATIYLEPDLFRALKFKAAEIEFSVSELVDAAYRVRKGNYRVLYTVDDDELLVRVIKVGHRRAVYR